REILGELTKSPYLALPFSFGFIDRFTAGFFALVGTFYFHEVFGLGSAETGITLMFFFAPFALLQYPMGRLSDRVGRAVPIVVGSSLYGVGVIAVGVAPSLGWVRASLFVVGILGALVTPATMALVTDIAAKSERGAAMGGFNIFGSLGFLAGVVVGGKVADTYGFFEAFVVAGMSEIGIALVTVPLFLKLRL
ncbi:MAG: MFS transporter, partial [Halobacteria archaeon]|nr:MFS transporter [Halobacteria archaeon]